MNKVFEEAPDEIVQYAERCVVHVKNRFGFDLDYGPEMMGVLDHFVTTVVADEAEGITPAPGDRRRSHLLHLLAPTVGAYFGEVLRREFPSRWRYTSQPPSEWILEFEEFFLRFNPAGAAASAIMAENVEDWGGSIVTSPELLGPLHERLSVAPPLPEDQFYTFTARHEVLQIAQDYLKERAVKDGPVPCGAEDYDRVFGI